MSESREEGQAWTTASKGIVETNALNLMFRLNLITASGSNDDCDRDGHSQMLRYALKTVQKLSAGDHWNVLGRIIRLGIGVVRRCGLGGTAGHVGTGDGRACSARAAECPGG